MPELSSSWTYVSQPWSIVHQDIQFLAFVGQEKAKIRKIRLQISDIIYIYSTKYNTLLNLSQKKNAKPTPKSQVTTLQKWTKWSYHIVSKWTKLLLFCILLVLQHIFQLLSSQTLFPKQIHVNSLTYSKSTCDP